MYVEVGYFLIGYIAGITLVVGYILGTKYRPAITDSAITTLAVAPKRAIKVNPPAPLEEEAIVPEDVEYNAREELFKKLREENKIEYISIE